MSKVTDRLDNKQIVELAKKQYEQQKRTNKFPANIVKFPSAGKVYPESSVLRSGELEMRHMTAYDEDILTNSTYINNGVVFDKLLVSLVVTPGFDVSELIYADKESLIISARILGYGNDYVVALNDSKNTPKEYSHTPIKGTIDLSKLKYKDFPVKTDENGFIEYVIKSTKDIIKYKVLSESEIISIDKDQLVSQYLTMCIQEVNGSTDRNDIKEFLQYSLRAVDSRELRNHITGNMPGIETQTTAVGEDGSSHPAVFQFSGDIFRI